MLYFDHAATTPLEPAASKAMDIAHRTPFANPASQHYAGRATRRIHEQTRTQIAALLGVNLDAHPAHHLLFTSGGTESNNLALFGLAAEPPQRIIISSLEHSSVTRPAQSLAQQGVELDVIESRPDGAIRLHHLQQLLEQRASLVAVTHCNHETGVLQPIPEIAELCATSGVRLHVDAAQSVGRMPLDFPALGATTLAFAAHKFGGPVGIGGLLVRAGTPLRPQLHGGFQQHALRAGTEDVVLAIGMHAALEARLSTYAEHDAQLTTLRDRFEQALRENLPAATVQGDSAKRLPHTSNVAFPPLDRQTLFIALDAAELACSTGSACESGSSEPSPTLTAMGLPDDLIRAALRFSFSPHQSTDDVDQAVERILKVCNHLQSKI